MSDHIEEVESEEVQEFLDALDSFVKRERTPVPTSIELPDIVFKSDKALGTYIVALNEYRSHISKLEKLTKAMVDEASEIMLKRLEATGMKHFAYDDIGTFSKRTSVKYSFPEGGKTTVAEYLELLMDKGIVTNLAEVLDLQQSRLSGEPIEALREQVEEYNKDAQQHNEEFPDDPMDLLPEIPFRTYEAVALTAPKKYKA